MEVQKPGEELVSVRQKEKKMGANAGKKHRDFLPDVSRRQGSALRVR